MSLFLSSSLFVFLSIVSLSLQLLISLIFELLWLPFILFVSLNELSEVSCKFCIEFDKESVVLGEDLDFAVELLASTSGGKGGGAGLLFKVLIVDEDVDEEAESGCC